MGQTHHGGFKYFYLKIPNNSWTGSGALHFNARARLPGAPHTPAVSTISGISCSIADAAFLSPPPEPPAAEGHGGGANRLHCPPPLPIAAPPMAPAKRAASSALASEQRNVVPRSEKPSTGGAAGSVPNREEESGDEDEEEDEEEEDEEGPPVDGIIEKLGRYGKLTGARDSVTGLALAFISDGVVRSVSMVRGVWVTGLFAFLQNP